MLLAGSTQDYSAYFTPDDPDAFVLFSGSALTLCAKPSATLEGDTLTVSTSSNYKPDAFVLFVASSDADGRLLAVHSENIAPIRHIYLQGAAWRENQMLPAAHRHLRSAVRDILTQRITP